MCFLLCALFQAASGFVTAFMFSASRFFPAFLFCGCARLGSYRVRGAWFQLDLLSCTVGRVYGRLRVGYLGLLGLDVRPGYFWFV